MIEKEEITSTEFPEGGNTISTKGPPASQRGDSLTMILCCLYLHACGKTSWYVEEVSMLWKQESVASCKFAYVQLF